MAVMHHTSEFLLGQCARYPELRPLDLLNSLRQSAFGCGSFPADEAERLQSPREKASVSLFAPISPAIEPLDGDYCRVHLQYLQTSTLSIKTLFYLSALSAREPSDDGWDTLADSLACLLALAEEGKLPFSPGETEEAVKCWRAAGYPACRHSEEFYRAYAPAYCVVRREYARLLPLLAKIDRLLAEKPRIIVALEGGSAAGKSTAAALLEKIYDCSVFHMDDFFLRPEQRTKARLTEPGGNVDWERFQEEVLSPLTRGETVRYRRYNCHTQTVEAPKTIVPRALNIVEGVYSMRPELAPAYDLSVFLSVSPKLQHIRIEKRNDPDMQAMFFVLWIPLENSYFDALDVRSRCDLILESDVDCPGRIKSPASAGPAH